MSSKLTVKSSKKDRPRSSDKLRKGKRDGTPEKPSTPNVSQDALLEEGMPDTEKKPVLVNSEILGLQIKHEDLQKLREPRPPSEKRKSPTSCTVVVRKLKPASEWDKPVPRIVTVARPAPPDAPLKPVDHTGGAGPRFDEDGNLVPHSILGSVDDYQQTAVEIGDLPQKLTTTQSEESLYETLSAKYEKKPKVSDHPKMSSVEETNALRNWQNKMMERKKQQGYLSKLLNKPAEQLVMNQSDTYRQTQELRYLIDRTIPTMDYGKGYRIGSEFWKQQEIFGDDVTGLHMTLGQTEKGYPPPIEHVGVPNTVLQEKGVNWARPRTPFHKPWHKTPYLKDRRQQLQQVMKELDPHQPNLCELEVVGTRRRPHDNVMENGALETEPTLSYDPQEDECIDQELDPLRDHPDVYPGPVFGPSIQFAGQPARWTGHSGDFEGQIGLEARVTFEAFAGHRTISYLEVTNDGTTTIYYDWKSIPKTNPFDILTAKVQRFYFNTSSGVILPGDTMKFPFVFKSPNAGVFSEQWQFETHPVVCGGAALMVTLRGVALQEDKFMNQRSQIERELAHKQAEQVVGSVLNDILEGIRSPERPQSPVDAYITKEEIFHRKNPSLHYASDTITQLHKLYSSLIPEEEKDSHEWDLSIQTLKEMITAHDAQGEDVKQELLQKLNQAVISLSFPPFTPVQQQMYNVGYQLFCEAGDQMLEDIQLVRTMLGMPEKEFEEGIEDAHKSSGDSKRSPVPKGGGGKSDPKDKKGRESKSSVKNLSAKETSKGGGKITPGLGRRSTTREKDLSARKPSSASPSPLPPGVDSVLDTKYKDKIYTQTYMLVSTMLDKMDQVFSEIQQKEGRTGPPSL